MMFQAGQSLLNLQHRQPEEIVSFFKFVQSITDSKSLQKKILSSTGETAALLFFEPSTRTRVSFQSACARLGLHPIVVSGRQGTSGEKGETDEDTIKNIASLEPSVLIVRAQDELDFKALSQEVSMPIINAGWGKRGHPTQALLDVYTLWKKRGNLQGLRLLFIGDIAHSRIVSSHLEFLKSLKIEVGFCAPDAFCPPLSEGGTRFTKLDEALPWADAVMALRVQFERHNQSLQTSPQDFHLHYGLTTERLRQLKKDALIMHPGPINYGIEMAQAVVQDPRSCVLEQVNNGLWVRVALLHQILGRGAI